MRGALGATIALLLLTGARTPAQNVESRSERMQRMFMGGVADSWEDLQAYTGLNALQTIVGEDRRLAYLLNYEQLAVNYGQNVEFQLRREQVILCPQTEEFLYSQFTPLRTRYTPGSRPELEAVVAEQTADCATETEAALALMRFTRELYRRDVRDGGGYIYGGIEEQLIAKGERLCETLGRLYVALCEVAGIPGRIVMHDIGGHIAAEVHADGGWAYVDPRCGVYFRKSDGALASVRELRDDPSILRAQPRSVKDDVGEQWTWEERVTKCEQRYFHPREINGFQNYSLADAERYRYEQLSAGEAKQAGLFRINGPYRMTIDRVFGLADDLPVPWRKRRLRTLPLAYRNDGFSQYFRRPPLTREMLQERLVDPFADSNTEILVWGLGPGSVFCFDTRAGELYGSNITEEQWRMLREGDRWVYENVKGLIDSGAGPLQIAIERAHELGLKLFARLEMQHEYGPADDENWLWVALVGQFNKQNPHFRIPGRVLLDFKHPEVRAHKLAVLREAVEMGADGLSLDFVVYPPFFEEPNAEIMTGYIREIRAMCEEVGAAQGREVELMVRVPSRGNEGIGLDPPGWMREGLVDYVVVSHLRPRDYFDIRIEDFVQVGRDTGVPVFGCLWHSLGFVTTDLNPKDEDAGLRRYDKPKTREMYYAQALMLHRAGADGIQVAMPADNIVRKPWLDEMADSEALLTADKHYMVDPATHLPMEFPAPEGGSARATRSAVIRIGDDIPAALVNGHEVAADVLFYSRALQPGETLRVFVNGHGPLVVSGDSEDERKRAAEELVDLRSTAREQFVYDREWWKRGEHRLSTEPHWWRLEHNVIRFEYSAESAQAEDPLALAWIDVTIDYDPRGRPAMPRDSG